MLGRSFARHLRNRWSAPSPSELTGNIFAISPAQKLACRDRVSTPAAVDGHEFLAPFDYGKPAAGQIDGPGDKCSRSVGHGFLLDIWKAELVGELRADACHFAVTQQTKKIGGSDPTPPASDLARSAVAGVGRASRVACARTRATRVITGVSATNSRASQVALSAPLPIERWVRQG
jgi:hypothetical protein